MDFKIPLPLSGRGPLGQGLRTEVLRVPLRLSVNGPVALETPLRLFLFSNKMQKLFSLAHFACPRSVFVSLLWSRFTEAPDGAGYMFLRCQCKSWKSSI